MKKEPKKTRFEVILIDDINPTVRILKDKQTGVLYLFADTFYGGGLTPLLDADGKPIVEKGGE